MQERIRVKWRFLLTVVVAPALLIGLGVTLAMNRTGQATSDEGTPEAQPSPVGLGVTLAIDRTGEATSEEGTAEARPCPTSGKDYPEYSITIEGNAYDLFNGTWDLQRYEDKPFWSARFRPADSAIDIAVIGLRCREGKWGVNLRAINVREPQSSIPPTGWEARNTTGYPDAAPFEHVGGPSKGGAIVVHKR